MRNLIALIITVLFVSIRLVAQDDQSNGNHKISTNGNLRLFSQFYNSDNSDVFRTSPLSYGISGNLSFSIGDFKVPISLVYRENSLSFKRPFFYLGMSPKLGPVQFHLGNRNLNFSQYTLGGASFFGVGAEVKSGVFRFGAMTGSFQNPFAQRDSIVYGSVEIPTFDRKGYSAKIGIGRNNNFLDLIYLRITDEYDPELEIEGSQFNPKDNSVVGLKVQQGIGSIIKFKLDAAVSAITNDLSFDLTNNNDATVEQLRDILNVNPTTNVSYAGDAEIQFRIKRFKSSLLYRKIYPHYISLGSTYITPDKEEYLVKLAGGLFKNKLRLNSSLGWQRNNLSNERSYTSNRFIASLVLLVMPSKQFRTTVIFNNYDISSAPTIIEENDSLKVVRVMKQFKFTPIYRINNDHAIHSISGSLVFRVVNGQFLIERRDTKNKFLNLGYGIHFKPLQLNGKLNINFNQSNNFTFTRDRYGGSLSVSKLLFDKSLTLSINNSYFRNLINDKIDGSTYRSAFLLKYSIQGYHQLQLSLNYIIRNSIVFQNTKELQFRSSYGYSF